MSFNCTDIFFRKPVRSIFIFLCSFIFLGGFFLYQKLIPLKAEECPFSKLTQEEIETVRGILKDPLKFLGYGSQCFAFLSKDEQHVVKICRASRYRSLFSSKGKEKKDRDFLSYLFAFQEIPEQTQVTFLHLNQTQDLKMDLKLIDPLGFSYSFPADETAFYIQKKAIPLPDYLKGLSKSESRTVARQLLNLFESCCNQGLQMRDIYPKNIGVNDHTLLWIDPGRITPRPSLRFKEPQKKALYRFKALLSPFLEEEFSAFLEEEWLNYKE